MGAVFGVVLMAAAGLVSVACAINFFWQTGYKRALVSSALFIGAFLLFWASGAWVGASRHSWGVLAPLLVLILGAIWLCVRFLPRLTEYILKKINEK